MRAELKTPDCGLYGAGYYLRLWITNTGKEAAENVQVFAAKLVTVSGGLDVTEGFLPQNLRWTHTDAGHSTFWDRMNPDMGRHCDLGEIPQNIGEPAVLRLLLEKSIPTLTAGVYHLTVMVAASNAKPKTATVEVKVGGQWTKPAKAMFEHLGLRIVDG
ncbi:MAG TPA: hypothetical protein VJU61_22575 [Polyangiaceae bacterium]|nr:hypothetical protein [Polyangiaceae bacterium]